jgi:hypothetical protein
MNMLTLMLARACPALRVVPIKLVSTLLKIVHLFMASLRLLYMM